MPASATRGTQVRTEGLAQVARQARSRGCLVVCLVRVVLRIHRLQLRATRQVIALAIWVITERMEGLARLVRLASIQALLAQVVQPHARIVLLASIQALLAQPHARIVLLASIQALLAQVVQPHARIVLLASTPRRLVQAVAVRVVPAQQAKARQEDQEMRQSVTIARLASMREDLTLVV